MKQLRGFIILSFLSFLLGGAAHAQNAQAGTRAFPRLESDPRALEFFRRSVTNNGGSWTDLAEMALWASGGNASDLERIRAAANSIARAHDLPAGKRGQAEFILSWLHKNVLISYSLNQTRVDTIFANGRFNCVSSGVLYLILCKSLGIEADGVMTRDHALVTVHIDGESIDVETTNAYGFDPGSRKEFHDDFGRLTGFSYVPARNYRDRQTITAAELISLIMTNRISDLESRNLFSEAIPLAIDRAAFLTGLGRTTGSYSSSAFFEDPGKDMLNRLYNYSAFLLNSGREEDCLAWTTLASHTYPNGTRWQEFIHGAVNNRIHRFVQAGHITQARDFLEANKSGLTNNNYAQLDAQIFDAELLDRANKIRTAAEGESVIADIHEGRRGGRINERRADELMTFSILKTAERIGAAPLRDWLGAENFIEHCISRYGSNRELERALQNYRNNRAVDYHNRFAAAWNRRDYDEARRILGEGLKEFPENRQLLNDRDTVNRSTSR